MIDIMLSKLIVKIRMITNSKTSLTRRQKNQMLSILRKDREKITNKNLMIFLRLQNIPSKSLLEI